MDSAEIRRDEYIIYVLKLVVIQCEWILWMEWCGLGKKMFYSSTVNTCIWLRIIMQCILILIIETNPWYDADLSTFKNCFISLNDYKFYKNPLLTYGNCNNHLIWDEKNRYKVRKLFLECLNSLGVNKVMKFSQANKCNNWLLS